MIQNNSEREFRAGNVLQIKKCKVLFCLFQALNNKKAHATRSLQKLIISTIRQI